VTVRKLRVALLCGGRSGEREISFKSADQVARALDPQRYEVIRIDPSTELTRLIEEAPRLDLALIILHGRWGEDGTVQGLLELLDVPYQGSGVLSSAICMDKRASKELYRLHGLPVPWDLVLDRNHTFDEETVVRTLGLPVVVKPATEGSSLGLSIARSREELVTGLALAFEHDRYVIVEEYIRGREITVSVWGNDALEALPLIEICPSEKYEFYDYEAKYKPGAQGKSVRRPYRRSSHARLRKSVSKPIGLYTAGVTAAPT